MKKMIVLGLLSILASGSAFAWGDPQTEKLCPKYYCTAESDSGDYHHEIAGTAFNDDLATAESLAVSNCEQNNEGGSCVVTSCVKNTGPVLKIFNTCQSQW